MGILIVVDMQNDFINGTLGTNEAQTIVPNVVEKIKEWDGPIFVTRDTHSSDYLETREGKYLPVPHCIENTHGWELNEEVAKVLINKEVSYINKPTFGSTYLPTVIKDFVDENTTIEIVGLCTDICVISNALLLKANFIETDISVIENCCAGVTPESHQAALTTMKMCQINVK
jgi:nicotinamidase-related amidase